MNPYLITLTFLTLISILTSSEAVKFSERSFKRSLFENYFSQKSLKNQLACLGYCQNLREACADPETEIIEKPDSRPNSQDKDAVKNEERAALAHPVSLKFDFNRPPNNSRLNFLLLVNDGYLPNQSLRKIHSSYEMFACLLRVLYANAPFYSSGIEYRILDELKNKKEDILKFADVEDLATISFDDELLQNVFFSMLKGKKNTPSLFNILRIDRDIKGRTNKKINFLFTPETVLEAIFFNYPQIQQELLALREEVWKEILDQETNRLKRTKEEGKSRSNFSDQLSSGYEKIVSSFPELEPYLKLFDFSLGSYGDYLFLTDSKTGLISKQRIPRR